MQDSIKFREYGKFLFTKSINGIFENLIKLGKEVKINRHDLEFLDIKTIIKSYNNLEPTKLYKILNQEISTNKKNYEILKKINLSDFIKNFNDVYAYEQIPSKEII